MLRVLKPPFARGRSLEQPTPPQQDDLGRLVQRHRSGDPVAQRTLLVQLGPPMLQVIRRVMGSRHPDVEDALQEAMMALVRALGSFRAECTARQFACRIAAFTAISARRRQRAAPDVSMDDADEHQAVGTDAGTWSGGRGPQVDWALAARRRQLLRELLDELPVTQAEALVLHAIAGLTVEELAGATGVPFETVRSRLRLAREALRVRISGDPMAADLLEDYP